MLCFSRDGSGSVYEEMMYFQQLCFFFFCFSVCFFFFLKVQIQREAGNREKRFDHGSQNREVRPRFTRVPFFSYRTVLNAKRIAKMSGSRFFRLDRMVRSEFQNLGGEMKW